MGESFMSELKMCPRGGNYGVYVAEEELIQHAKDNGYTAIDYEIPLPDGNDLTCKECDFNKGTYYESDTGLHGWCCQQCGRVIQWG
jgi:hypothetical protein